MSNFKKRLSSVLGILFIAMTFLSYVPVKATETIPNVTFVGVEHSPLVVGDSETFYLSATGAEKVQYRVFQNKIGTDKWEELTSGYTDAENANAITTVNGSAKYELGKYKLSIWVKKADAEGKFKNKNGSYDSYYVSYLNCVSRDNNNRVYTNGDMDVEKDTYVVGETVKVNGIKDISGMKDPYTYKLHVYDVNSNEWKLDKEAYRKDLSFVADKPGTYVLDVWAMSSNSTLWSKEAKLKGRIYEAWKLKVITVKEKVEPIEIDIVENGVEYGSQDAKNPMEISKNINITANDVVLKNVNVKGNVTVTGDNVTIDNANIVGTLVLDPGEKGTVNLSNVTANTIEVLSGAENSIHFNNVNAKVLNIKSKNLKNVVRVELKGITNIEKTTVKSNVILEVVKGSFGNIEILESPSKTENLVEFRGSFEKSITVKTNATLKTAKDAKVSKIIIEPTNNEKITLDGIFDEVEVNSKAVIYLTENTKVQKITTNASGVTLELGKGAIITTLDQKTNVVTITGSGTVTTVLNPPTPPVTGGGGGYETPTYRVTGVSLDKTTANLNISEVLKLTATINPSNATNKGLTWTSSNEAVAKVTVNPDKKADVEAIGAGTATITVKTVDGGFTATCIVTVPTPTYSVTGVVLNKTTANLIVAELLELTATINPSNATNKNVIWTSSNEDVATVTGSTGTKANVKAIRAGTSTITVTTVDGAFKATCKVTVTESVGPLGAVVKVDKKNINVLVDNIKVKNQAVTIKLYNKSKETIVFLDQKTADAEGKVTFGTVLDAGEYHGLVKAMTVNGYLTTELDFKVIEEITGVSLDMTSANLLVGEVGTLRATITPSNVVNKNITWTSSNNGVVTVIPTVEGEAKITAMGVGTAIITVKTEDGGYTATCEITVSETVGKLIADVDADINKVTISVNDPNVKNQAITITLYNKANDSLAFLDQENADAEGKVSFSTVLDAGEYYGFLKCADANLLTEIKFVITRVTVDELVKGISDFVNEQETLKTYMTFGEYKEIGESRSLEITVLKKDSTLEDMFMVKDTANLTLSEKLVLRNLIYGATNLDMTVNADYLNAYLSNKLAQTEYKDYTKEELIDLLYTMDYASLRSLFNSLTWLNEEVDVVLQGKVVEKITIDVTGTAVEIYNNVDNKKVTRENIRKALGLSDTENLSNMTLGDFVGTYVITMEDGTTFTANIK